MKTRIRYTQEEKQQILNRYGTWISSVSEFCKKEGISVASFYSWKHAAKKNVPIKAANEYYIRPSNGYDNCHMAEGKTKPWGIVDIIILLGIGFLIYKVW